MARTISAGYVGGITLLEADNPLTITSTGSISSTDAAALTTAGTVDWVIGNAGTIAAGGTVAASVGIQMNAAGGTITNAVGGHISGGQFGIYDNKHTTLTNSGTIIGSGAVTAVAVRIDTGEVTNSGGTIKGAHNGVQLAG